MNIIEGKEVGYRFMAHYDTDELKENVWLVDSGCSNHMAGRKELFKELDESKKMVFG